MLLASLWSCWNCKVVFNNSNKRLVWLNFLKKTKENLSFNAHYLTGLRYTVVDKLRLLCGQKIIKSYGAALFAVAHF